MLNVHNQDKLPFESFTRILFCFCSFVRIFAASLFWFYLQLPPSFYVQIPLIWLSLFAEHCRTWWSILTVSIAMYIFIQHFKVIPLCFLYIFHLLVYDRMQDHENKTNRKKRTWTKGILIYHINTYIRYTYNCIIEVSYVVSESWEYLNERVFIEN